MKNIRSPEFKCSVFSIMEVIVIALTYINFNSESLANAMIAVVIIALFCCYLAQEAWRLKARNLKTLMCMAVICFILFLIQKQLSVVSLFLFIILMIISNEGNFDINFNVYTTISLMLFGGTVVLYLLFSYNAVYDTVKFRELSGIAYYRRCLGFIHPNVAMYMWFSIVLSIWGNNKNKHIFISSGFIILITAILCKYTYTRSVFLLVLGICLCHMLVPQIRTKRFPPYFKKLLALSPLLLLILSCLAVGLPENSFWNNLFSGRFRNAKHIINTYGVSLFGNSIIEGMNLDNAYLHILLGKGILFTAVYLFLFYMTVQKSKYITWGDAILILGYLAICIVETLLLKFSFVLLLFMVLYNKKQILP